MPVFIDRDRLSPSASSLCAILSSTALIVLVMLCRARSAAEAARRLRPPSPTARESSAVSASISCSARSARSTFPAPFASSNSSVQLGEPAPVSDLGLIVQHLARVTETADMHACLCEFLIGPRQANCRLAPLRPRRAGSRFLPPDRARGIRSTDDGSGGRRNQVPCGPSDERIFRRGRRSNTRRLCGKSHLPTNGNQSPDRRNGPRGEVPLRVSRGIGIPLGS